jgi:uncharacterized protein (TIGR02186 family)
MKRLLVLLTLAVIGLSQLAVAEERAMVTELQTEHVDVNIDFTGKDTLIFGALLKKGDVIVKVRSPDVAVALSRKSAFGFFWLDSGKLTVRGIPGLYYLLSSRPITEIVTEEEQQKYGLHLRNALISAQLDSQTADMGDWQTALIRLKQSKGLFRKLPDAVKLLKNRLFSANIQLPASIPLGTYKVDIYLIHNNHVISHQTQHLDVHEVRLERWVATAVDAHSWLFGIAFTVFALFLGLTLGMALRRS